MNFWQDYSNNAALEVIVPLAAAIATTSAAILLRRFLFRRLHRWSARTESEWDDILVHSTRLASLLWCFWLGIFVGAKSAVLSPAWEDRVTDVASILFVVMGIYTAVTLIEVGIDWYTVTIARKTKSVVDDLLMGALKWIVPLVAGLLGLLAILHMVNIESERVNGWIHSVDRWLGSHWIVMTLLVLLGLAALLLATAAVPKVIARTVIRSRGDQTDEEVNKRSETLSGVLVAVL
ncbi:MAG: hypothetical protein NTU41_00160, partial [Chloroflexi bacterium]|nr:hypothetical protein [Chloroflexota bacterium]